MVFQKSHLFVDDEEIIIRAREYKSSGKLYTTLEFSSGVHDVAISFLSERKQEVGEKFLQAYLDIFKSNDAAD